jgi:hypothetical protein
VSQMNPYEDFLDGQDPLKIMASTGRRLEKMIEDLGEERLNHRSAPGKWSAREIVCHLADTELVFAFRLRQTLSEERHTIQPFAQEQWAAQYAAYDAREALTAFCGARNWNLALLRSLPPEVHSKPVSHPELGEMTFYAIVETMGGHDANHLRQLEAIARHFAPSH